MRAEDRLRVSRRLFLKASAAVGAMPRESEGAGAPDPSPVLETPDLRARWIWYPERRTLPCTFVFFRREFELAEAVAEAQGWVSGNSRYILYVNGKLVQRGPAPCDPRYWDVDPVDLRPHLREGKNVIAGLVCNFGGGDGTYVPGVPVGNAACAGFLFQAEIKTPSGWVEILTGESWQSHRARCWPAGGYQRWYLRALQEQFDARLYPDGWNTAGFAARGWRAAKVLDIEAGRPVLQEVPATMWQEEWRLEPRTIPPMIEEPAAPKKILGVGWVTWKAPPREYFESFPSGAFTEEFDPSAATGLGSETLFPVRLSAPGKRSAVVTFDFGREVSGYPYVRLRAPAGAVAELLFTETQDPDKLLLRTAPHYGQWIRVVARQGETHYEAFDWDVFRYLQVAVRGSGEPVEILEAGVTERRYPYPYQPDLKTPDETINRAIRGAVNTHLITSQDTLMDNITRERQQYAGDVDHAKLTSYYGFGEYRQAARMIRTYSQGQNKEGWFMDCWPAWDRCERLWQKSLDLTQWGPILDHGVNFVIAAALHYLFSGDKATVEAVYPKLLLFDRFLWENIGRDGLLPVEWVRNSVWIDHRGFKSQADKQAAFNIYYAGMLRDGIARLAEWMGDGRQAAGARERAAEISAKIRERFWSEETGLFVDNLPRVERDGELRLHERTLAMALLFGLYPEGREGAALDLMAAIPAAPYQDFYPVAKPRAEIGFSFPANAGWRLWALSRFGRGGAVVRDVRERWGRMPSLLRNGTFSENWVPKPSESGQVWCQNGPVPIYILYGEVLGIRPVTPAFEELDLRPQLGDLAWIEGTVHSPKGAIHARCSREGRGLAVSLRVPAGSKAALVFPSGARVSGLPEGTAAEAGPVRGTSRWRLPVSPVETTWTLRTGDWPH